MKTEIGEWKIIQPSNENLEQLLKTTSEKLLREAKLQLDSTEFDIDYDTNIDEVLKLVKPSIVVQDAFVDFYMNILHSFPKKERRNNTLRESHLMIWKKIEPHLRI